MARDAFEIGIMDKIGIMDMSCRPIPPTCTWESQGVSPARMAHVMAKWADSEAAERFYESILSELAGHGAVDNPNPVTYHQVLASWCDYFAKKPGSKLAAAGPIANAFEDS